MAAMKQVHAVTRLNHVALGFEEAGDTLAFIGYPGDRIG